MLNKDQKVDILNSRINVIESYIYNVEISILEEESKDQPIQIVIDELNIQKSDHNLALLAVKSRLEAVLLEEA